MLYVACIYIGKKVRGRVSRPNETYISQDWLRKSRIKKPAEFRLVSAHLTRCTDIGSLPLGILQQTSRRRTALSAGTSGMVSAMNTVSRPESSYVRWSYRSMVDHSTMNEGWYWRKHEKQWWFLLKRRFESPRHMYDRGIMSCAHGSLAGNQGHEKTIPRAFPQEKQGCLCNIKNLPRTLLRLNAHRLFFQFYKKKTFSST